LNQYEGVFIIDADLEEDATEAAIEEIEAMIAQHSGAVHNSERWGKKSLCYEIKKHRDGYYVLVDFEAEPGQVKALNSEYRLVPQILRHAIFLR